MARREAQFLFALLLGTGVAAEGAAQEPPSVGDITSRPGQSQGTATVPRGSLLLNPALQQSATDEGGGSVSRTFTSPDGLVRVGVADSLEVRGGGSLTLSTTSALDAPAALAVSSATVGGTARVFGEEGWLPALALLTDLQLPVSTLRPVDTTLVARLAASRTLWGPFGTVVNVGARGDARRGATALLYTAAVTVTGASGLSSFIEVFGDLSASSSASLDAGVAFDVTRDLRVDVLVGVPLVGPSPTAFVGAGVSLLYDASS